MPIPTKYQHATDTFKAFLNDAMEYADLGTINQTYTMVQGVFQVFRRRVDEADSIRFANALPPVLTAIYIDDWDFNEPTLPFTTMPEMNEEVKQLRAQHNFALDGSIEAVARALHQHVNPQDFARVLATLPQEAQQFWQVKQ